MSHHVRKLKKKISTCLEFPPPAADSSLMPVQTPGESSTDSSRQQGSCRTCTRPQVHYRFFTMAYPGLTVTYRSECKSRKCFSLPARDLVLSSPQYLVMDANPVSCLAQLFQGCVFYFQLYYTLSSDLVYWDQRRILSSTDEISQVQIKHVFLVLGVMVIISLELNLKILRILLKCDELYLKNMSNYFITLQLLFMFSIFKSQGREMFIQH